MMGIMGCEVAKSPFLLISQFQRERGTRMLQDTGTVRGGRPGWAPKGAPGQPAGKQASRRTWASLDREGSCGQVIIRLWQAFPARGL